VTDQNAESRIPSAGKILQKLEMRWLKKGKFAQVIGRDEEIRRVLQILARRTKNNPILLGEARVGKPPIGRGGFAAADRFWEC